MLAYKIRQWRKGNFITQAELARRCGHPASPIHGIESNDSRNLRFFTLGDIVRALGVFLNELYLEYRNE